MNPRFITRTTTSIALFALCVGSAPALRSQAPSPGLPGYRPLEQITDQTQSFAVTHLAGKPVRSSNQEELGTISDFLIEPRTGGVHFAIAKTEANTFRLVPMTALQQGSSADAILLGIDRSQWDQIPTMSEQELLSEVTLDANRQQQLQQQFHLSAAQPPAQNLIRATLLNEREVRSNNEQIGRVDDVVIDFHNRIAAPIVELKSEAGQPDQRVLVHFSHLQVSPHMRGPITTSLSTNEFRQLQSQSAQLSPTGHPSGFGMQSAQQASSMAQAVQQALDRDPSITAGAVQAYPETRIVLRGMVDSEQKKSQIEQAAQQAAPGVRIDNQVMVRSR